METKFKSVAHLYLGCNIVWGDHLPENINWHTYSFKGIDCGISDVRAQIFMPDGKSFITPLLEQCKPILRPLSDMTEEEAKELDLADVQIGLLKFADRIRMFMTADQLNSMLKMGFDLFSLIESGQALDKTTLTTTQTIK